MSTLLAPLVVLAIGAFTIGFSSNSKLSTMGYIAFAVGLFYAVARFGGGH